MEIETLDELVEYADLNHFDLEKMHYKVNENTLESRWYGIYHEYNHWFVYHNHSNGERVMLYEGTSEKEACETLLSRIDRDLAHRNKATTNHIRKNRIRFYILIVLVVLVMIIILVKNSHIIEHKDGYYVIDQHVYYVQDEDWFYFDGSWHPYAENVNEEMYDHYYGNEYEFDEITDDFYYSSYNENKDMFKDHDEDEVIEQDEGD